MYPHLPSQCWRRYLEEGRMRAHVFNAGKYLSALVAITCRLWYLESQSSVALVLGVFTAIVATIAQSYWDLVVDWGLLRARARHAWLRDQLILKREWVYFVAMVRPQKRLFGFERVRGNHKAPLAPGPKKKKKKQKRAFGAPFVTIVCVSIIDGLADMQVELVDKFASGDSGADASFLMRRVELPFSF